LNVVEKRFKIFSRDINKERDGKYKDIAGQEFAGGCLGRAAKRIEVLEEYASMRAVEHVAIYRAVAEEFGSTEMTDDTQLDNLESTVRTSASNECASVQQMSERDCTNTGGSPSAIDALAKRYPIIASRITESGTDQIQLLRAETAARRKPEIALAAITVQALSRKNSPTFPNRALWLDSRLAERKWDKNTLEKFHGPEHRTTQKILDGKSVSGGPLRKVVTGLNGHTRAKKVTFSEIPND
jgi:hypothetical protein